jgi:lipopolysaccharide transport system ATP-binding protein
MSDNAIIVENLSKRYLIGHKLAVGGSYKYTALRDIVAREINNFARKAVDVFRGRQVVQGDEIEEFWAIRDVSFDVKHGEVFGVIGRNGAGKSTLLKILSRITEPTIGRISLSGRVASLLEVGTGFHPELSGRENIFLNGAILGMTQREIRKKFDEIVAFAEVERFIDSPVKYYSSGMYVRLAFAVAAHLEPEILVVDEVLAVGDFEFQKKCLGKMDEVAKKQGRTVLFVSHNMEAILKLCTDGILLESGHVRAKGDVKNIVASYFSDRSACSRVVDLLSKTRPEELTGRVRLSKISPSDEKNNWSFLFGESLSIDLSIDAQSEVSQVEIFIGVFSAGGFEIASWSTRCHDQQLPLKPGTNVLRIAFQHLLLLPGQYFLGMALSCGRGFEDYVPEAVSFEITSSAMAAAISANVLKGAFVASAKVSILN